MSQTRKRRLSSGWTGHAVAGGTRLVLGGTVAAHCGQASRGVPCAGRPEPQSTEAVAVQPPFPSDGSSRASPSPPKWEALPLTAWPRTLIQAPPWRRAPPRSCSRRWLARPPRARLGGGLQREPPRHNARERSSGDKSRSKNKRLFHGVTFHPLALPPHSYRDSIVV